MKWTTFGCPQCNKCKGVYIIFFVTVMLIFIYWLILGLIFGFDNVPQHDFMNVKMFNLPLFENCCSLWPISHFILFLIIGYLYPNCDVVAISGGVLWEVAEVAFFYITKRSDRQPTRIADNSRIEYSQNWWMGSFKDIIMNILGFYLGKFLAKKRNGEKFCSCCDKTM